ncbi:hypothetical protein THTE_3313 [Thermogutta terrifontis]|uniref:Uncharacterized protein n=1 Tax=Thermogutta terrifontis TaxID=1331910 RepID=A0A286RIV9_9BACT|nr:hypothetical protein [Thermogutta terrifontis]ASV75915.1 hypothetical protein THTE_3313 [Thermogutta terrifontis]
MRSARSMTASPAQCHHLGKWIRAILAVWLGVAALTTLAEDAVVSRTPSTETVSGFTAPLRFRRVFVPQDRLNEVRDPVPYFPLNAAEFEQMISRVNNQAVVRGQTGEIVSAVYRAIFRQESLVGLEGEWLVELPRTVEQAFIPLGQPNIAIGDATWSDTGGVSVPILTDSQGRLGILVNRSGKIHFRWSARRLPSTNDAASMRFSLTFPVALTSELHLIMTEQWQVSVDDALLLPMGTAPGELPGYRIVFSGSQPISLLLVRPESEEKNKPRLVYREKVAYELTLHGLEATWVWDVDVLNDGLDVLPLELPSSLQIAEVKLGDAPISWTVGLTDDGRPHGVRLRFPEPLRGRGRTLTLRGIQNLPLDRIVTLPSLLPENAFWLSRHATVVVRHPLRLYDLQLAGARLKEVITLPAAPGDTGLDIVGEAPTSEIRVHCGIGPEDLEATTLLNWSWDRDALRAQMTTAVRSRAGEVFQIPFRIRGGWAVEEVTATPPDIVDDWQWQPPAERSGDGTLLIRLRKPISSDTSAVFNVVLSTKLPEDCERLELREIVPFASQTEFTKHQVYGAIRLATSLRENFQIDSQPQLPVASQATLDSLRPWAVLPASATVFEIGSPIPRCEFHRVARPRRFLAQVSGVLAFRGKVLTSSYEVSVQPDQSDLDRIRVLWTAQSGPAPWHWKWRDKDGREVTLRVAPVKDAQLGNDAEVWEVVLPRVVREPVTLIAERESPLDSGPVPLPILLEAVRFEGVLQLVGTAGESGLAGLRWTTRGLRMVADDRGKPPGLPVFATYRYEGGTSLGINELPELRLFLEGGKVPLPLWALSANITYRLDCHGTIERWHIFKISCPQGGRAIFTRSLNEGDPVEMAVTLDGQPVTWETRQNGSGPAFQVVIPPQAREGRLIVWERFADQKGFIADLAHLSRLFPDFPVYHWRATVWTPPAYQPLCEREFLSWGFYPNAWASRLFGPLWRPPDQPLFIPDRLNRALFDPTLPPPDLSLRRAQQFLEFLGENAAALLFASDQGSSQTTGSAAQAFPPTGAAAKPEGRGTLASPSSGNKRRPILWRDLLSDSVVDKVYDAPPRLRTVIFLVDRRAFEELGLSPAMQWSPEDLPEGVLQNDSPAALAETLLESAGLVLAITPRAVVLTSLTELARHRQEITWERPPIYKLAAESDWVREIETSRLVEGGEGFCRVRVWNDLPDEGPLAPRGSCMETGLAFARQGWNATALPEENLAEKQPLTVLVIPVDLITGSRWLGTCLVFLLVVALRVPRRVLLGLAVAAAVGVAFVPEVFAPVLSGAFLGTVLAFVVSLTQAGWESVKKPGETVPLSQFRVSPTGEPHREPTVTSNRLAKTRGAAGAVVLLIVSLATLSFDGKIHPSFAQQPPGVVPEKSASTGRAVPASPPVYRVFIPVDERGQPVGQEVYVPEEFYKQLQRRASPLNETPPGWQFAGAVYRGTFSPANTADRWEITDFSVTLECLLSDAPATLDFPLGSDVLVPSLDELLIDGRPASATWNSGRLRVTISDPGRHRLRIPFKVQPSLQGSVTEVSGAIPPVVNARLELAGSPEFLRVEFPSALGRVERDPESGAWAAELGPTGQLVVRWATGQPLFGDTSPESDVLYVLDLRPEGFHWTVRWKLRSFTSARNQLQLVCDPDLTLVSLTAASPVQVQPLLSEVDQQVFNLTFSGLVPSDQIVTAEFSQAMEESPGGIRLPTVRLADVALGRQDLVVNVGPGLKVVASHSPRWQLADLGEIQGRWQLQMAGTALAYTCSAPSEFWGAWILADPPRVQTDDALQITVGEASAHLTWQVFFPKDQPLPGVFHVRLPPDFHVNRIALYKGAVETPVLSSLAGEGQLLLLTGEVPTGEARLVVEGTISILPDVEWSCPRFTLQEADSRSLTVVLFQSSGVKAEVVRTEQFEPLSVASGLILPPGDDSQVGAYVSQSPSTADLHLRVRVQEHSWPAEATVRVWQQNDRWLGEVLWDLDFGDATVQEIPIQFSPAAFGTLAILPTATFRETPPDAAEATSSATRSPSISGILTFAEPQTGRVRLRMRGEIKPANRWLAVPQVTSPQVRLQSVRVLLPKRIAWDSRLAAIWGLRPITPSEIRSEQQPDGDWVAYQTDKAGFWPPITVSSEQPGKVNTLEMILAVNSQRELLGWLEAELENVPEGEITTVPLPGCELVAAWLDGIPVPAFVDDKGRWHIPIDASSSPRDLECLFYRRWETVSAPETLPVVHFEKLAGAERTFLWVESPSIYQVDVAGLAESILREYELTRARWLADKLIESSQGSASQAVERSLRVARRFLWLRDRARRAIALSATTSGVNSAEIRLHNMELQTTDVLQSLVGVEALSLSPGEWAAEQILASPPSPHSRRRGFVGESVPKEIILQPIPSSVNWTSIGTAVGISLLSAALLVVTLRWWNLITVWVMRFAHAVLALVGVAWWLLLRPSFFGWLLILAAILLLIRSRWQWVPQEEAEVPLIVHQPMATNDRSG